MSILSLNSRLLLTRVSYTSPILFASSPNLTRSRFTHVILAHSLPHPSTLRLVLTASARLDTLGLYVTEERPDSTVEVFELGIESFGALNGSMGMAASALFEGRGPIFEAVVVFGL
ncbi:hypothetical protein DOTSEDRAFT_34029 [Dothistroma septosporum NZE10]|uniref:Uncharacterized protein n=1 Tax=Dothistroma septosporum (strain NZE10 / CBS 128990) TaxID=675120 RepID=N1PQ70_DOTSN|nr:hypothetical protein DOTSEDRAFT_34029 [Dothistroma septosporum NZE10]